MSVVQIEHICVESWHSRSVVKSYWVESFASETGIQLSTFRLPTKCVNRYITEKITQGPLYNLQKILVLKTFQKA